MPALIKMPQTLYDTVIMAGGLDLLTPVLSLRPGYVRDAVNFECAPTGGYARIGGYERFDGRARPSDATYQIIQVTSFTNVPAVGDTLTGNTSGATGQIIAVSTGNLYMAITLVVGAFTTSEVVKVGATTIGTATPATVSISSLLNAQYLNLAADVYRALIGAVPGSGPVRGVVSAVFSGTRKVYAFRDNAGATACVLHENSGSGWTAVTMYNEVSFTLGGATVPADGATLTQGANTATIKRVVHESGSWGANTAAGRFIVTTPAPGNFAAGAATIGAINVTLGGVQTAITLATGGKYEFDKGNFAGQLSTRRIYGCDGVNKGFEFDGTVYVPIKTFAATDTPKHVRVHNQALFFFIGASAMISGPGVPYKFNSTDGGAEIAVGDTVTGSLVQPGSQDTPALGIFSRNLSHILYGTAASGSNPWKVVTFAWATGAFDYMQQNLDRSYFLDDRGIISFQAAQEYGNFTQASLTNNIQPFITEKRSNSVYSCTCRDKSQFRTFFSDGSGLFTTIVNGKLLGNMPIQYPNAIYCAWSDEDATGNEEMFVGAATGGMVYQLDRGSSFDGANIDARIVLNWHSMKSTRIRKRYRRASLEMQGSFYAAIQFGYSLGYGSERISQPTQASYPASFAGESLWDVVFWDQFIWDGATLLPTEVEMRGTAENVQFTILSTTDYIYPFTLNSLTTHYTMRRGLR